MTNYYNAYNENNTIACRNNGIEVEAHGAGYYEQHAYAPKITTIAEAEGFTLRTIESVGTKYEILWDGEVLNRYPNLKTAPRPSTRRLRTPPKNGVLFLPG